MHNTAKLVFTIDEKGIKFPLCVEASTFNLILKTNLDFVKFGFPLSSKTDAQKRTYFY